MLVKWPELCPCDVCITISTQSNGPLQNYSPQKHTESHLMSVIFLSINFRVSNLELKLTEDASLDIFKCQFLLLHVVY
jgi:hypothetical protein